MFKRLALQPLPKPFYSDIPPQMTPAAKKYAIEYYSNNGFIDLNHALTTGTVSELTGLQKGVLETLCWLLTISTTPCPSLVYRGLSDRQKYGALKIGDRVTKPAFMSTSKKEAVAKNFGPVRLVLSPSPGSHCLYIARRGEQEVLFPPESHYTVTGTNMDSGDPTAGFLPVVTITATLEIDPKFRQLHV